MSKQKFSEVNGALGKGKLGHDSGRYQAARMKPVVQRKGTHNTPKPKGSHGGKLKG